MTQPFMSGRSEKGKALLAMALLVPAPTIGVYLAMVFESTRGDEGRIAYGLSKAWILLLPLVWRVWVDKDRLSFSPARKGGFKAAALLGVTIGVVILAAYGLIGRTWIDPETVREAASTNGIGEIWQYLGLVVYLALVNSLLEEYVWRWFVFRKCETLVGGWPAVLLSAAMFTIHHIVALKAQFDWSVTIVGSLGVFVGGAVWSWCYLKYRSIWPGYVSHLIADVVIFVIGWHLIFGS